MIKRINTIEQDFIMEISTIIPKKLFNIVAAYPSNTTVRGDIFKYAEDQFIFDIFTLSGNTISILFKQSNQ